MVCILSRMDMIVAASVERIQDRSDDGMAVLLMSSFSMPLPGLPVLYMLLSMRSTPERNVVMASWLYWLLELRGSASLLIAVPWSHVVACTVKQASAMFACWI